MASSAAKGMASVTKSAFTMANATKFAKSEADMIKRECVGFGVLTYLFYALGTRYSQLGIHWWAPDPKKWTDEELGIPSIKED